jgi:hypothetical protein
MLRHGMVIYKNLGITSFRIPSLWRRLNMWTKNMRAVYRYRPEKYHGSGRVILYQTKECQKIQKRLKDKSRSITYFIDNIEIVPVNSKHFELLIGSNAKDICDRIRKVIMGKSD